MAIIINDEAKKLLKDKNKNYILVSLFQQACWGGGVNKVIGVYIDYRLNIGENVEIGVEKFLFMKYFNQVGITAL